MRRARAVAFVISLVSPCLAAAAAGPAPAEPSPALPSAEARLTGMTLVVSRAGQRELLLEADRASLDPEANLAVLERVHSLFEGRPGTPGFEMTCERGEVTMSTNEFVATGHVEGQTADGRHFATEWVRYDPKRSLVYTDAPVQITEHGGSYEGGGFRYLVREQRFRLLGGASLVRQ